MVWDGVGGGWAGMGERSELIGKVEYITVTTREISNQRKCYFKIKFSIHSLTDPVLSGGNSPGRE